MLLHVLLRIANLSHIPGICLPHSSNWPPVYPCSYSHNRKSWLVSFLQILLRTLADTRMLTDNLCSASSSNKTADGLVGLRRNLGIIYNFVGDKIENILGWTAERVFHRGPRETNASIKAIYRDTIAKFWVERSGLAEAPSPQYLACLMQIKGKCTRLETYLRWL